MGRRMCMRRTINKKNVHFCTCRQKRVSHDFSEAENELLVHALKAYLYKENETTLVFTGFMLCRSDS